MRTGFQELLIGSFLAVASRPSLGKHRGETRMKRSSGLGDTANKGGTGEFFVETMVFDMCVYNAILPLDFGFLVAFGFYTFLCNP